MELRKSHPNGGSPLSSTRNYHQRPGRVHLEALTEAVRSHVAEVSGPPASEQVARQLRIISKLLDSNDPADHDRASLAARRAHALMPTNEDATLTAEQRERRRARDLEDIARL